MGDTKRAGARDAGSNAPGRSGWEVAAEGTPDADRHNHVGVAMTRRLSLEERAYTLAGLYAATSQYEEMKADVLYHLRTAVAEAKAERDEEWGKALGFTTTPMPQRAYEHLESETAIDIREAEQRGREQALEEVRGLVGRLDNYLERTQLYGPADALRDTAQQLVRLVRRGPDSERGGEDA